MQQLIISLIVASSWSHLYLL